MFTQWNIMSKLYCHSTPQCNHWKGRAYTSWGDQDTRILLQLVSGQQVTMIRLAIEVERSHSVRVGFMHAICTWHIFPLPWRWSGVTCVCPLKLTFFLHIYTYGVYNTHCLQSEYFNMTPTIILYYPVTCMFVHANGWIYWSVTIEFI